MCIYIYIHGLIQANFFVPRLRDIILPCLSTLTKSYILGLGLNARLTVLR